jgi:hypothetical protein
MFQLPKAMHAWNTPAFEAVLKDEIEQLNAELLPLQQGLTQGSYANDDNLGVIVISMSDDPDVIHVKAGLCYTGVLAGCSCADDPTPENETTEYCEVLFDIDKQTAATRVSLVHE